MLVIGKKCFSKASNVQVYEISRSLFLSKIISEGESQSRVSIGSAVWQPKGGIVISCGPDLCSAGAGQGLESACPLECKASI